MNRHALFSLSILLGLTGCSAGFESEYSCDQVGGVSGCVTMNEVRDNLYGYTGGSGNATVSSQARLAPPSAFTLLPRRNREGEPERSQEDVKKLTVFPFIDKDNHYIDTMDVYFVLDDSRWSGRPARAIWKD
ncbi:MULTISPECIES: type IV conjugative transfer system lipoprotein TraV [Vibrio]|jgi:conjugal transfer pilus assembly protein TraV|uniref:IncF plasmid conjugative transfer pilus assemblyprotein TraV n=12 Tax=Vibrio TaxID=662 RepID=A0A0H3ZWU4_9VIBR|nr:MULTISPECIES: type IV conjugative transfer system lipoprotein TraV [Vibrio]AKN38098.1 IncF plasmid conjugative transfer pilus assemblyprotein TraV [Vibrio splendidus]AKN38344.1 IncF plasmid conjugative transfer pilus assemblyprotein TraV [Vibrio tasmaniensis]MCC4892243.1 type IV conjugative transfer system lipoprotein TraV [Vibrio sp. F13]MCF7507180.1 type IV conjugative transfer system lipoprotein TraV [Vibrio sp. L3-7]OEF49825.1 type IV conjugative transfer system protein TraV [Vibrio tas